MDAAVYYTWETKAFDSYAELKNKYSLIVKKINDIQKVQEPKISRKEALLDMKSSNTISQVDELELILIESEDRAEEVKQGIIKQALSKYEETVKFANDQYTSMIAKAKRIFDSKKRMAERRVDTITREKAFLENNKTAAEMTATREKNELLKNMNTIVQSISSSRKQYADAGTMLQNLRMLPTLPEELAPLTQPLAISAPTPKNLCPCGSSCPKNLEFDMPQCMVDEEASSLSALTQAKQQAIEEDRKIRREIERKEALAAEERMRLLQDNRKKEEEKEHEQSDYKSDEESEDEEEVQRQIEEAKEKQRIYLENRNSILKRVIEIKDTIDKKPIKRVTVQ